MTSAVVRPVPRFAPVTAQDHSIGPDSAPVTLVMYGNYECLHCRRAYPSVEAVRAELGPSLRFVHRHFAVAADFPHAELAAEAAESAAAQGKFWEMHGALSLHARFLDEPALLAEADRLGLDVARVVADLESRRYRQMVRGHTTAAFDHGITSTPMFFVNGDYVGAGWDLGALRETLRDTLRETLRHHTQ